MVTDRAASLKDLMVTEAASIRDTMDAINRGARQIALVVDEGRYLRATVTDGDIRRGLLRGVELDAPVTEIMHTGFTAALEDEGREAAVSLIRARGINQIPMVDAAGRLVDLVVADELPGLLRHNNRVVLMAGGLGTRLRPLTDTVPKPMLPVGTKPILELILRNFTDQGFRKFTIALNYRGEMIREHFGDGAKYGAEIEYIDETKRMGTAGALSLLKIRPDHPFVVMNGDLLTTTSFSALVRFHAETGAIATMCAREYPMQVPYGVIEVENSTLRRIVEKPTYSHFVNAGIYVLSPEALDHVMPGEFLDMPTLFERFMATGALASVFPIQEYWVDIGCHDDLERVRTEFALTHGRAGDLS
jgi:dTDP-glucose pyrophosphorylase